MSIFDYFYPIFCSIWAFRVKISIWSKLDYYTNDLTVGLKTKFETKRCSFMHFPVVRVLFIFSGLILKFVNQEFLILSYN